MKKIIIGAAALTLCTSAFATNVGDYIGVKAGLSMVQSDSKKTDDSGNTLKSSKTHGFGYGAQLGYNFTNYFGLQLGVNKFSSVEYNEYNSSDVKQGSPQISIYDVDFMGFGYLPIGSHWDAFLGAGVAYVKTRYKSVSFITDFKNKSERWWRPKAEIGVGYDVNQNLRVSASYSRIFGKGKMQNLVNDDDGSKYLPDLDMAMISFDYSFGNSDA